MHARLRIALALVMFLAGAQLLRFVVSGNGIPDTSRPLAVSNPSDEGSLHDEDVTPTPSPWRRASTRAPSRDHSDHNNDATVKVALRRPGREKLDLSHAGLVPSDEGINHAWPDADDKNRCHGAAPVASCVSDESIEYFKKHILLGIVTGREDAFRVEVSQCTWLSHFPPGNVIVVTDVVPKKPRTPQRWMAAKLPAEIEERDGDLYSQYIKKGYVRAVRSAGQGYSAAWIVAQLRFPWALQHMAKTALHKAEGDDRDIKWVFLVDDDTIINIDHLVARVKDMKESVPWYLSRKGWGGAGHLYSIAAMRKVDEKMHECVDKWMIRQFRASDAMLLKCSHHLHLKEQLESTMSHCPASNVRDRLLDKRQVTVHGKKDLYPPVLLATWRTALYYHAMYCGSVTAKDMAIKYSACAFGNCKSPGCDKNVDAARVAAWNKLSRNGTLRQLPLSQFKSN
jgi:hypothetical protein